MSSDGDTKDRSKPRSLDVVLGTDEVGWADAIDEWDAALDLPEDPPAPPETHLLVEPTLPAVQGLSEEAPSAAPDDAQMESPAELLDTLLGLPAEADRAASPEPEPLPEVARPPLPSAIDAGAEEAPVAEDEIRAGEAPAPAARPLDQLAEQIDLDAILGDFVSGGPEVPPAARLEPARPGEDLEALAVEGGPAAPVGPGGREEAMFPVEEPLPPPSGDLFESILPTTPAGIPLPVEVERMLTPIPAPREAAEDRVLRQVEKREWTIPEELDEEGIEELVAEAPQIPEALTTIRPAAIELPEQGAPIALSPHEWQRWSERLHEEAQLNEGGPGAANLEYLAAHALEELGETVGAITRYRDAVRMEPDHLAAMRVLRRLLTRRGEPALVAELLKEMCQVERGEERMALVGTCAELVWTLDEDEPAARALLEELEQLECSEETSSFHDMRRLLLQADLAMVVGDQEELQEVIDALLHRLADSDAKNAGALRLEVGRTHEARGEVELAKEAYTAAFQTDPELAGAAEGLLRTSETLKDYAMLARTLAASGERYGGTWGARRIRRSAILARNHGLSDWDPLSRLRQAAQMAPEDPLVLEELAETLCRAGDYQAAMETYKNLGHAQKDSDQQAVALVEAARIAEEKLASREEALTFYREAAVLAPGVRPAVEGLARLELSDPDAQGRLRAQLTAAQVAEGGARLVHRLAAAKILEEEVSDEQQAIAELVRCLEQDPSCRPALSRLERILTRLHQPERLAAVLDAAADQTNSTVEATELRERIALLYEGLGRPDQALERYRKILTAQPEQPAIQEALVRLLMVTGQQEELAEELLGEAETTSDDSASAHLWTLRGELLLAAGQTEEAMRSYTLAVSRVAGYPPAAHALVELFAREGEWREVAAQWRTLMASLPEDNPQRKALMLRLGALYEHSLDSPHEAADFYRSAAKQPLPVPGAKECLFRVYRAAGEHELLAQEMEQGLSETQDPAQRFALLMSAAELLQRGGASSAQVEDRLSRALQEMSDHPLGRAALLSHHQAQGDSEALTRLWLGELDHARSVADRVAIFEQLAALDRIAGRPENVRRSLESIIQIDPGRILSLRRLQRLYLSEDLWSGLPQVLCTEAEHAADHKDGAALWLELGRLLSSPGQKAAAEKEDRPTAKAAFLAAVGRDPLCLMALRFLVDLAWQEGNSETLAQHYLDLSEAVGEGSRDGAIFMARAADLERDAGARLSLYLRAFERFPEHLGTIYPLRDTALLCGDWQAAIRGAEAEGRASHVREHVAEACLLAGELAHQQLGDLGRAMAFYEAALQADPSRTRAFTRLREILEQTGRWSELANLLVRRSRVELSKPRLVELHRALAKVASRRLNDRELAKRHLRQLLQLKPEDMDALTSLSDLFFEDEQWSEAAQSLLGMARSEKSPEALVRIFLRLGLIYAEKTPDNQRAIACFGKVLSLDLGNNEALCRLSDLFFEAEEYPRALQVTENLFEVEADPARRVKHLLRIARIHEEGFKDIHKASISFRRAVEMAPLDLGVVEELMEFFRRQGDQRSFMVHLDQSLATMRNRLEQNAFDAFPYRAMFKMFGWRKAPDGCLCAAQALTALGQEDREATTFIRSREGSMGSSGLDLLDPQYDDLLFHRAIPGGFHQVCAMLGEPLTKVYRGDLRALGVKRSERLAEATHPLRRMADLMAQEMAVMQAYELYLVSAQPNLLFVENTDPPAILVGEDLVANATEQELRFIIGRSLWIIGRSMVLPVRLPAKDVEAIICGIVAQYSPDFLPPGADPEKVLEATRQVSRAMPRKIKAELMPFALECSGATVKLAVLGPASVHTANRAGLLACRSVAAAVRCLGKAYKQIPASGTVEGDMGQRLRGNWEAEDLLRFAVSGTHLELRRAMGISIG